MQTAIIAGLWERRHSDANIRKSLRRAIRMERNRRTFKLPNRKVEEETAGDFTLGIIVEGKNY